MIPQISEFSYGFALTNELVGWLNLSAAPIFPSLLEEGKAGGGYDVKFDKPGIPLYLQFKRAEFMKFPNAKQFRQVAASGQVIDLPFFRFYLMQAIHSQQHEMLLDLDDGKNAVFYAAPRFYQTSDINSAWTSKTVADKSVFITPSAIGPLPDNERHCVAYDPSRTYFCSAPRRIESLNFLELQDGLTNRIDRETRPLREVVEDALAVAVEIRNRPRHEVQTELPRLLYDEFEYRIPDTAPRYRRSALSLPPIPTSDEIEKPEIRKPRERKPEESALERLAEIAIRDFDLQLVIIQSAE